VGPEWDRSVLVWAELGSKKKKGEKKRGGFSFQLDFFFFRGSHRFIHTYQFLGPPFCPTTAMPNTHFQGTQAPSMDPPPGRGGAVTGRPVHA